jgi:hypothetical protein
MRDNEELAQEIATLSAHLDAATHRLLECIRSFDETGGWHEQGAISCAHWLSWRVGWDPGTARERVRVARALGKLPLIDEALRTGGLSYAKARALTRVANPANEARLLAMALLATGAQLERLCRGYRSAIEGEKAPTPEERSVHRRVLPGGMVKLELVLEPEEADLVLRAVDRAREVRAEQPAPCACAPASPPDRPPLEGGEVGDVSAETPWPSRADGMVKLAESFLADHHVSGSGGERFQVMVHLDQEVLDPDGAWSGTLEDGTRVSAETLRRVACDCGLVAVGHDGQALNIGRRARSIPPAIRRALMLRDHGCAFPGCTHTRFLHAHHVEHWLHGGATSLDNLVMLCSFHHHQVHEGGWRITAAADKTFLFHPPGGNPLAAVPPREQVGSAVGWLRTWAEENDLHFGLETNMPQWDGKSPDYELAVSGLLEAGCDVLPTRRPARRFKRGREVRGA